MIRCDACEREYADARELHDFHDEHVCTECLEEMHALAEETHQSDMDSYRRFRGG